MKKVYCLSTCSTCREVIEKNGLREKGFSFQDIKTEKITPAQLDALKALAGSYEALFSRRAMEYKARGLAGKKLTEKDYRDLILEHYTFLKRPVVVEGKKIMIGKASSL